MHVKDAYEAIRSKIALTNFYSKTVIWVELAFRLVGKSNKWNNFSKFFRICISEFHPSRKRVLVLTNIGVRLQKSEGELYICLVINCIANEKFAFIILLFSKHMTLLFINRFLFIWIKTLLKIFWLHLVLSGTTRKYFVHSIENLSNVKNL